MAKGYELDLEVIDAGVAHALYAASLVNLAISFNRGEPTQTTANAVTEYACRLAEALVRCGVNRDIPTIFQDAKGIIQLLSSSKLMTDIGNSLVQIHGTRQEKLWMITCLLGGAFSGGNDTREQLRPHVMALAQGLPLSADVLDACLNNQSLQPLRHWVSGPQGAEMAEIRSVFIGHGRSHVWRDLKDMLSERLGLRYIEFNSASAAGIATKERLEEMLDESSFAFLVMTAEDLHNDGSRHARENVVHEIGLFQGRLGFKRAIVLLEEGCEEFSNLAGVGQIRFPRGNVLAKSEEIRMVLEREGMLNS
jgi:predicted nucleotide-binding protein